MGKIYKGDIGTRIELDAGSDISTADILTIIYKKPDDTIGAWYAQISGTQKAYYDTKKDDLDVVGRWEVQLYVATATWKGTGTQATFTVYDINEPLDSDEEEIQGNYITESDIDNWTEAEDKQAIIDQAEQLIEKLTHDIFYSKDVAVTLDGNGKDRIFLGLKQDIISVSEVLFGSYVLDPSYYTNDKNSVYANPSAYDIIDPEIVNGILFTKGMNNIRITCIIGHTTCPGAIKQAAIVLVRADNDSTLYSRYSMNESESVEGFSFKRPKRFLTGIHECDRLILPWIRKKLIIGAA